MFPVLKSESFTNDIFSDIANLKVILAMSTNPNLQFDYQTLRQVWREYFKNKGYAGRVEIETDFKNLIY